MFPCRLPAFCDVRAVRISFFFNRVEQRHILELLETTRTRSVSRTPVFMLWTLRNPHVSMKEENLGKWHNMAVALICVKQEWIPVEGEHCIVASKREKNAVVYRRGLGEFERREVLAHPPSGNAARLAPAPSSTTCGRSAESGFSTSALPVLIASAGCVQSVFRGGTRIRRRRGGPGLPAGHSFSSSIRRVRRKEGRCGSIASGSSLPRILNDFGPFA